MPFKRRRKKKRAKRDIVYKTFQTVNKIKRSRHGRVDNSEPETWKKASNKSLFRRRREKQLQLEHERRLKKMRQQMSESHSVHERRKNKFDATANPVFLFRRKIPQFRSRKECLTASSDFLGRRDCGPDSLRVASTPFKQINRIKKRPSTAPVNGRRKVRKSKKTKKSKKFNLRPQSAQLLVSSQRNRSRPQSSFKKQKLLLKSESLVDEKVIHFQNMLVDKIVEKRMWKADDIVDFLGEQISKNLHFSESDLLNVAKYICTEFSVGLERLASMIRKHADEHLMNDYSSDGESASCPVKIVIPQPQEIKNELMSPASSIELDSPSTNRKTQNFTVHTVPNSLDRSIKNVSIEPDEKISCQAARQAKFEPPESEVVRQESASQSLQKPPLSPSLTESAQRFPQRPQSAGPRKSVRPVKRKKRPQSASVRRRKLKDKARFGNYVPPKRRNLKKKKKAVNRTLITFPTSNRPPIDF